LFVRVDSSALPGISSKRGDDTVPLEKGDAR
jgi:hypothetical protein